MALSGAHFYVFQKAKMTEARITLLFFLLMTFLMTAGSYLQLGTAPACYTAGACFFFALIALQLEKRLLIKTGYDDEPEEEGAK